MQLDHVDSLSLSRETLSVIIINMVFDLRKVLLLADSRCVNMVHDMAYYNVQELFHVYDYHLPMQPMLTPSRQLRFSSL